MNPVSLALAALVLAILGTAFPRPAVLDDAPRFAAVLRAQGGDSALAEPVAQAVAKYAAQHQLDPTLVLGVITVENRELKRRSRSSEGAVGVMQVMPFWKRYIKDCGTNLLDVDTNVCFGTRILRLNLDEAKSVRGALLRYNGCVRRPGCRRYPDLVLRHTARIAEQLQDSV